MKAWSPVAITSIPNRPVETVAVECLLSEVH